MLTHLAGGFFVFKVPFFGSTKNSTMKTGPWHNKKSITAIFCSYASWHLTFLFLYTLKCNFPVYKTNGT
ncbi:hypothetical protein DXD67_07445 [Coprococcus comes]|uniref:Uncharacterized protein n=1 Tax=Coprococcus comes TaxID=410072 RepID=A0A3E4GQH9_9FIRM|nr:hypothetical protein DXD67_07445 [Coprococcus comes]